MKAAPPGDLQSMVSVVSCSHPCQVLWFFSRGGGTAMKTKKT
ncbi:hypothetical protein HMPREF9564_01466 [Cutibacterium acnes HL053PA1]|nr:hypothetical protein HMPREF9616_02504 [Cutibacterium acnes HL007PA1]EFT18072.1 hypothetical protein HMPREF9564_01466 [Cutibacterium acnes HL053PA1]EFT54434.1 hypothetical protein HMPREF9569_00010 [Cutibacterium acnes HL078PA1]EFT64519.1 hypothetical protein HMPREF9578_01393 [Cutibacterium acnes HL110PA4]EFT69612.1 hypothetical protein HMPREF9583_02653 [Cutibacterium acnes HL038PA1]EGE75352.1 hypothetical protein HMPREF9344_01269 [Cutibacterium acnes HL097PA1]